MTERRRVIEALTRLIGKRKARKVTWEAEAIEAELDANEQVLEAAIGTWRGDNALIVVTSRRVALAANKTMEFFMLETLHSVEERQVSAAELLLTIRTQGRVEDIGGMPWDQLRRLEGLIKTGARTRSTTVIPDLPPPGS